MPLGMKVRLGPGQIALDEDKLHPKGAQRQFAAHVYCGQTVGHLRLSATAGYLSIRLCDKTHKMSAWSTSRIAIA